MIDTEDFNEATDDINKAVSFVLINGSKEQTDYLLSILLKATVHTLDRYVAPEIMMLQSFHEMLVQLQQIQESGKLQNIVKESKNAIKH